MLLFKRSAAYTYTGVQSVGQFAGRWLSLQLDTDSRIKSVEGVRGIACLTVIWFHLNEIARNMHIWNLFQTNIVYNAIALGGSAGVTLFFVLSGFLLFMPYVKATLFESQRPATWRFYLRRMLRIIPGYYFSLGILILLTHPEYLRPDHLTRLGLFLTLLMNTPSTFMKINGPYWTLAIEWQFYLILPWLAPGIGLIVRRIGGSSQRKAWIVAALLLGVIAWGVSSRYWGAYLLQHPTQTFLIPRPALNVILFFVYDYSGKCLEDFAVGMLISICYILVTSRELRRGRLIAPSDGSASPANNDMLKVRLYRLSSWFFGSGLLLLLFMALWHYNMWYPNSVPVLNPVTFWYNIVSEFLMASGFGLCLTAILFGTFSLRRVFEWHPLRFMGLISYSLYIWHLPLLVFFMNNVGPHMSAWNPFAAYSLYLLWIMLVIIPFTFLCYKFVEKPWMELSAHWTRKGVKQHA
jgi:peptidoglycan/LPS O-acetylase OafA/YrhL